ncbi:MAG: inverse autotransporter beta domain-containing protein [Betaproteobacteria bacterium]
MTRLYLKRWLLFGVPLIMSGSVVSVGGQTVEAEMRLLVRQLDLFVSESIIADQSAELGPEFRELFRTRPQLNLANVRQYFSTHPYEVMAFRRYIQQLTDNGFISGDLAESLVIAAFQVLELAPKNQALARSSILNPAGSQNNTVEVFDLKLQDKGIPETNRQSGARLGSNKIDFGESLDREQKAAIAAQALEESLQEQKRIERNKMLARALIDEFSQGKPSPESLGRRVERVVTQFVETETKKQSETFLDNAEISIASIRNGPEYELRGLKAFDEINPHHFAFTEFGLTSNEEDTTVNVGVGIRKLSEDQTIMGGVNAFYDQEAGSGHKRGSIGIELVSTPFRFNANRYYALSDGKILSALQTEKPMSGHDVDVELALPYFPGLFAGYNQSKWLGEDGVADVERKSYRLKGNLSKNLSVEIGKRTYSSSVDDQNTAKLSYNYIFGADSDVPTIIDMDTQPYRQKKIGPRERYRLVERENKIVTQVSQSGLQVTFTGL